MELAYSSITRRLKNVQKIIVFNCGLKLKINSQIFKIVLLYEYPTRFEKMKKAYRIQMGLDPFESDPLFEGRLHGIRSRTVGVHAGSDPFGFYELLAAFW